MTDQKALEATRYHVYFDAGRDELIAAPAPDGVWVRFSDLPKPEGEAVAVKPLEWDQVHSKVHREKAEALGFSYYLTLREPGYVLERRAGDYMSGLGSFDTIDLAKAAAQSDFDRCIRSALHPAPDAREAGLLRERQIAEISDTIKHWLPDTPDWMMEPMATNIYNALLSPAPVGEKVETDDGWIEWKGGDGKGGLPFPIPEIEYRRRDGIVGTGRADEIIGWAHFDRGSDIIAYRLSEPRK